MTKSRPNILFIFTDQQRPDWFSWTENIPVRTRNVASLAERGVVFENTICPSPVCAPSRSCLASGMEYDRCGVLSNWQSYPLEQGTHFHRLRDEAGYHVMGCGKIHIGEHDWNEDDAGAWDRSGQNLLDKWGFSSGRFMAGKNQTTILPEGNPPEPVDPYGVFLAEHGLLADHIADFEQRREERWTATFPTPLPDEAYNDEWITREALGLLDNAPRDTEWYLQVNLQNPHHPWDVTDEMYGWYRNPDVEFPDPVNCNLDVTPEEHQEIRRNYAAMIEHLDRCLGQLMQKIDERGERDDTIIVFSSDHGEMLGDHGQWQKLSPHQASVGVPLIAAGPEIVEREPVFEPATILDLHATFLDYADIEPGNGDSRSMRPYLAGEVVNPPREVVFSGLSAWRLAFDGRFKYIEGYDPTERVGGGYPPMAIDPDEGRRLRREREPILFEVADNERENVAANHRNVVRRLSKQLDAHLADTNRQNPSTE